MTGPWEKYQTAPAAPAPAEDGPWSKYAAPAEPAEVPNIVALGAGLGKGFGQVVLGAQNLAGKGISAVGNALHEPSITDLVAPQKNFVQQAGDWLQSDAQAGRAKLEGELAPFKQSNPLSAGAGEIGGQIVATLPVGGALGAAAKGVGLTRLGTAIQSAGMTTGAPAAAGLAGRAADLGLRAAGGAITGGTSAALVDPEQAGTGAVIGAVMPGALQAAGWAGSKIGNAIRGKQVAPEVGALAARAEELGIKIPADRLVNSKPLDAAASALNYIPFSGRAATEAKMNAQLNQALSKTFGQDSSNVTLALRKAESELGGKFDSFLRKNTVNIDQEFLTDLAEASNQAANELGSEGSSIIAKQIDEIVSKGATGQIEGQAAYNIKRTLDRIGNRQSPEAWYALDLKRKLMGALERSVGPEEAAGFATLRQQYGNMLDLQKIAKNGAEGEISVARLANMKNINNPQMQELADIAAQFVKPREGQHGAMQRAAAGGFAAMAGGPTGLASLSAAGRLTNQALNSGTLRDLVLKNSQQQISGPELKRLSELVYRSTPVIAADQ